MQGKKLLALFLLKLRIVALFVFVWGLGTIGIQATFIDIWIWSAVVTFVVVFAGWALDEKSWGEHKIMKFSFKNYLK